MHVEVSYSHLDVPRQPTRQYSPARQHHHVLKVAGLRLQRDAFGCTQLSGPSWLPLTRVTFRTTVKVNEVAIHTTILSASQY